MKDEIKAVHVRIEGRVQGVWFRGWTVATASGLDLSGWVRNRRDGSVEALFQGPSENVDQMVSRCRDGPSHARVTDVAVDTVPVTGRTGFETRPTL